MNIEKHITVRCVIVGTQIAAVLCSLIWSICYYNVKALEHPVQIDTKIEQNYDRK